MASSQGWSCGRVFMLIHGCHNLVISRHDLQPRHPHPVSDATVHRGPRPKWHARSRVGSAGSLGRLDSTFSCEHPPRSPMMIIITTIIDSSVNCCCHPRSFPTANCSP
jgi:hypothetical protein